MTNMNCFKYRFRRTAPARVSSHDELVTPPVHSRVNGWSLPLHNFQLVAWLTYTFLAIMGFGLFIPLLPPPWNYLSYGVIGTTFFFNLLTHLGAVSVDPADYNVRLNKDYSRPVPRFDKKKQPHVIHNKHCFLCDVDVGTKVKHCSTCNKCISDFDHHCKWLNNCVGGRNYWLFFMTILSAAFGVLLVCVVTMFVFVEHFLSPATLRTAPAFQDLEGNTTWLVFLPLAPVQASSTGLLILAFLTIFITLASLFLLCHLVAFHIFLLSKRKSTYEYILEQRQLQSIREQQQHLAESSESSFSAPESQACGCLDRDCKAPAFCKSSIFKCQDREHTGQLSMAGKLEASYIETDHFPGAGSGEKHANYGSKESRTTQLTFSHNSPRCCPLPPFPADMLVVGESAMAASPLGWGLNLHHMEELRQKECQTSRAPSHLRVSMGVPVVQSLLVGTAVVNATAVPQQLQP